MADSDPYDEYVETVNKLGANTQCIARAEKRHLEMQPAQATASASRPRSMMSSGGEGIIASSMVVMLDGMELIGVSMKGFSLMTIEIGTGRDPQARMLVLLARGEIGMEMEGGDQGQDLQSRRGKCDGIQILDHGVGQGHQGEGRGAYHHTEIGIEMKTNGEEWTQFRIAPGHT